MAEAVEFPGATHHYGPSPGEEERMGWLHCLKNGSNVVSAWKFTTEQLQHMIDSGEPAYFSVWSGDAVFPVFAGDKHEMNQILLDFGKETIK